MPEVPLLFLDVDGPLLPFGGPLSPGALGSRPDWPGHDNPQVAKLVPGHGPRLLALGCELRWATTWEHEANEVLSPLLGLPTLPVVDFPDVAPPPAVHWKTPALVTAAAGRAFAWVDDEITDRDRRWVAAHHPAPALLHRVDPARGLSDDDFATLAAWLRAISDDPGA